MPQFKIAKSDNIDKIRNNDITEDKLYIHKETNKIGKLFYDFDDNTRIEIGASADVYNSILVLTHDVESVNVNHIRKYNADGSQSTVNIDEIQMNSFVTTNKSLYSIKFIDRENNTVHLRQVYIQEDLLWNDYYGELYGYVSSDESLFEFIENNTGYMVQPIWDKNDDSITSIALPYEYNEKPVRAISEFSEYIYLTDVTIPYGVEIISPNAFASTNINDIYFPNTITYIGDNAFNNCDNIYHIILPDGLQYLGNNSFSDCDNLKTIVIPNTVNNLDLNVFKNSNKLSDIYFKGTKEQWDAIVPNGLDTNANIHYNWSSEDISMDDSCFEKSKKYTDEKLDEATSIITF